MFNARVCKLCVLAAICAAAVVVQSCEGISAGNTVHIGKWRQVRSLATLQRVRGVYYSSVCIGMLRGSFPEEIAVRVFSLFDVATP
jgi:hypothetical protein